MEYYAMLKLFVIVARTADTTLIFMESGLNEELQLAMTQACGILHP